MALIANLIHCTQRIGDVEQAQACLGGLLSCERSLGALRQPRDDTQNRRSTYLKICKNRVSYTSQTIFFE